MTDKTAVKYLTPCGGLPCGNYPKNELVKYVRADIADDMLEAAKEVESWWLKDGMHQSLGAPYAIFAIRAAIAKAEGGEG